MTHLELIEKRIAYANGRLKTLYCEGDTQQSAMFNQWIGRLEELETLKDILTGREECK